VGQPYLLGPSPLGLWLASPLPRIAHDRLAFVDESMVAQPRLCGLLSGDTVNQLPVTAGMPLCIAKKEIEAAGDVLHGGATLRIDNEKPPATMAVDCRSRLPICGAACCKLSFALSVQEVEAGILKWDLGWPYHIR
jgi:hypothetical protein